MKTVRWILLCVVVLCSALGLLACNHKEAEIYGFDVRDEIVVEAGVSVYIEKPGVYDDRGNAVEVAYEVFDAYGEKIDAQNDRFFATDGNGYVIRYSVLPYDNEERTAETAVVVKNAETLYVTSAKVADRGSVMTIVPVCEYPDPVYHYSVTYGGEAVELDGAAFICEKNGIYSVTVTAESGEKKIEYNYEILVRDGPREGEVEVFDENWEKVRQLNGYDLRGWERVTSAESGVKDRFGNDGAFIKKTVTQEDTVRNVRVYVDPRNDLSYYEELAEQGYDYISLWLYSDCAQTHKIYSSRTFLVQNDTSVVLKPNEWTEVKIPLTHEANAYSITLKNSYAYYKNQSYMAEILNSSEFPLTVYLDSVYAVKEISVKENPAAADGAYRVGDTVDLSGLFLVEGKESGADGGFQEEDFVYFLTDAYGNRIQTDGSLFEFTENGTFSAEILTKDTLTTHEKTKVKLTVSDSIIAEGNDTETELSAKSAAVSFADFGVKLFDGTVPVPIAEIRVYYEGKQVPAEESGFYADKTGAYVVVFTGKYDKGGKTFLAHREFVADVWSAEERVYLLDLDGVAGSCDLKTANVIGERSLAIINGYAESELTWKLIGTDGKETVLDGSLLPESIRYGIYRLRVDSGDTSVYVGNIDIFDSGYPLKVYNDVNDTKNVRVSYWGADRTSDASVVNAADENLSGFSGKIFKIERGADGTQHVKVNVLPVHEREYYENLEGYTLTYDYLFRLKDKTSGEYITDAPDGPKTTRGFRTFNIAEYNVARAIDTIYTETVPIADILASWNEILSLDKFFVSLYDESNMLPVTIYIGNIRLSAPQSLVLAEVKEKTHFDLLGALSEEGKEIALSENDIEFVFFDKSSRYVFSPSDIEIGQSEGKTAYFADVTGLDGIYDAELYANDSPVWSGTVDFYSLSDLDLFKDDAQSVRVSGWGNPTAGATVEIVSAEEEGFDDAGGTFFKIAGGQKDRVEIFPAFRHSLALMQSIADKTLVLDLRFTGTTSSKGIGYTGRTYNANLAPNVTHAIEIPVSAIVEKYDDLVSGKNGLVNFNDGSNQEDIILYLGNFRIVDGV